MNVLDKSLLGFNLLCGLGVDLKFNVCSRYYLLVDGMHLRLACFAQTIHEPFGGKQWNHFFKLRKLLQRMLKIVLVCCKVGLS
jgi:hypothetical protein